MTEPSEVATMPAAEAEAEGEAEVAAATPRPARMGNLRIELFLGFAMKAAGAGSSFVFTWLIARAYGPSLVGQFQVALSTASIFSVLAGLALDNVMVRSVSRALHDGRTGDARASFVRALRVTLLSTGLGALFIFLAAPVVATDLLASPPVGAFLRVMAPGVLLFGVIRISAALLRSRGKVLLSQSLDGVGYTTVALALIGVAWLAGLHTLPLLVPVSYVLGLAAAAALGLWAAWRGVRAWPSGTADISIRSGVTLACYLILGFVVEWVNLLIITRHFGTRGAGIYRVSVQVCLLFTIVNTAFAVMMGPHLAAAAAKMDRMRLRSIVRTASLTGLGVCAPLFVVIMIWGTPILRIFGPDFVAGAPALRVMAVAQFLNVAAGPVGTTLMMMHRERLMLIISLVATSLAVLTGVLAIPYLGLVGAAVAGLVVTAINNGAGWVAVWLTLRRPAASR